LFEFLAHGKLKLSDEAEAWPWSAAKQERWMAGRRQLTDEMVEQFREGCALLQAMSSREYDRGESKRYRAFQLIDKKLTWSLTALEARLRTTPGIRLEVECVGHASRSWPEKDPA
jgi:hypothetical protein